MMKRLSTFAAFCALLSACGSNQQLVGTNEQAQVTGSSSTVEMHRPWFHFTPPAMWMNDPNGMVYLDGEYHLFYQHTPHQAVPDFARMHWGHAVSTDLVHWQHLPPALAPDSLGAIFSGGAVVDFNNTSGLGTKDNPPIVAFFTSAGKTQQQSMAYSLDKGRTWTKYEKNPVLPNPGIPDFRDPKVMWYEPQQKWIMALAVADHMSFYSSKNLKDWQHESDFGATVGGHGGVWECPDLLKLPVAGTQEEKWVLLASINPGGPNGGSATQYFIGEFDGKNFVLDKQFETSLRNKPAAGGKGHEGIWLDYGRDNYAGVTWFGVPETDGRCLFIGWMNNWAYADAVPTENWRGAMTIPRSLALENTPAGLRVVSKPVKELQHLYGKTTKLKEQPIADGYSISEQLPFKPEAFDLTVTMEAVGLKSDFAIELSNSQNQKLVVGYDAKRNEYYTDRTQSGRNNFSTAFASISYAPRLAADNQFELRILVDAASVEVFADGGKTVLTDTFFPDEKLSGIKLLTPNGKYRLKAGQVTELKSIHAKDKIN
ncbi:glycoside hydrolase family 32 protein [Botryobacter ruber]|uniref:glycoside hydrolase family 32 protein n=1 Tax=Botryobacter ruber TaxID=2171629 RepID=UPI000E09FB53|nr:glycoside hydrolase family 32 protein [Botryobacter ruber]